MLAEGGCKQPALASQFVAKADHPRAGLLNPGADGYLVVVTCWEEETAANLGHSQQNAVLLHIAVTDAARAAQFNASDFHPNEVIGVVDHSHLVRLGIPHADARVTLVHSHRL
jgi:hypothetical protein